MSNQLQERMLALTRRMGGAPATSAKATESQPTLRRLMLREDVTNLAPQEQNQTADEIKQAVGVEVTVNQVRKAASGTEMEGVLRLGTPLSFLMTTRDVNGFYISCENLQLDEKGLEAIGRLRTYYSTWYDQQVKGTEGGASAPSGDMPVDTSQAGSAGPPPM